MDCVYRKRKSYMHRVLQEIESIIHKNIAEVLPNLSFDELEDDGTVFLMNGKNCLPGHYPEDRYSSFLEAR